MAKRATNGSAKKSGKKSAGTGETVEREAPRKRAAAPAMTKPNGPSNDEIREWLTEATELETEMARVRQKMSTLKKNVEGGSGDWKALKAALASTKLSQAEAVAKLEANVRYHRAINVRVSFDPNGQGTLDDVLDDPKPSPVTNETGDDNLAAARAYGDGWNSGRMGATSEDNPFIAGTREYAEWRKGQSDGALDKELADSAKANAVQAGTATEDSATA